MGRVTTAASSSPRVQAAAKSTVNAGAEVLKKALPLGAKMGQWAVKAAMGVRVLWGAVWSVWSWGAGWSAERASGGWVDAGGSEHGRGGAGGGREKTAEGAREETGEEIAWRDVR